MDTDSSSNTISDMEHTNHINSINLGGTSTGSDKSNVTTNGNNPGLLGSRAKKFGGSMNLYFDKTFPAMMNPYSVDKNPDGGIPLSIAENKLTSDLMIDKINSFKIISSEVLGYTAVTGLPKVRKTIANFLSEYVYGGNEISCDNLVIAAGVTALLHTLGLLLFEENDSVLIPAPYYPTFDQDFSHLGCVKTISVINQEEVPITSENMGKWLLNNLSINALEIAYSQAIIDKNPPKVLIITNPGNPMGNIYEKSELLNALSWARNKKLHIIFDEIYALSVWDTKIPFISIVEILDNKLDNDIHVLWGMSKDFGASGLRVGVLYSQNQQLLNAYGSLNMGFQVSNHTQEIVKFILDDKIFVKSFLQQNVMKLKLSYDILKTNLQLLDIHFVEPAGASIFCFVNFRCLLSEVSFVGERILFNQLADVGVVLTPGESCHCTIPGFFR